MCYEIGGGEKVEIVKVRSENSVRFTPNGQNDSVCPVPNCTLKSLFQFRRSSKMSDSLQILVLFDHPNHFQLHVQLVGLILSF